MGTQKLVLDAFMEDTYELIAIHCSLAPYKLAFLLNKHVNLRLSRTKKDINFKFDTIAACFPLFRYDDYLKYHTYSLLGNKYTASITYHVTDETNLFTADVENVSVTKYLIPELKNVDYFLKIETETAIRTAATLTVSLLEIPQIMTAYTVNYTQLKSKNNLILE